MQLFLPPVSGRESNIFGSGMNRITGNVVSLSAITGAVYGSTEGIGTDEMHTLVVEDSSSYASLLKTAASMSASGLTWSASASVSFLRENTGSENSISFIGLRNKEAVRRVGDFSSITVDPYALAFLKSSGAAAFADRYGTHVCIGVAYGGSFAGRLKILTTSSTSKQTLSASLSGSITSFGVSGSVSGSFEQDLDSSNTQHTEQVDMVAVGSANNPSGSTLADMMSACTGFTLCDNPIAGSGAGESLAFVCTTWDTIPDFQQAMNDAGTPDALQFQAEEAWLAALSAEYAALCYIANSCGDLLATGTLALPIYRSLLSDMANRASNHAASIAGLSMTAISQLDQNSIQQYIVSGKLLPLLESIAAGNVLVQISWSLDGAFVDQNSVSFTVQATPNGQEQNVGAVTHSRPPGYPNDPPQQMTLFYTLGEDGSGNGVLGTRMHFHDPYSGDSQDQDFGGNTVTVGGFPSPVSSAPWPAYPWNCLSASLVGIDSSV